MYEIHGRGHGHCNCECSSIVGGPIRPPTKSKSAGPILERRVSQRCARHVQCQRDYRQLPSRQATCLLGGDLQHILLYKAFALFKYNSRSMHTHLPRQEVPQSSHKYLFHACMDVAFAPPAKQDRPVLYGCCATFTHRHANNLHQPLFNAPGLHSLLQTVGPHMPSTTAHSRTHLWFLPNRPSTK